MARVFLSGVGPVESWRRRVSGSFLILALFAPAFSMLEAEPARAGDVPNYFPPEIGRVWIFNEIMGGAVTGRIENVERIEVIGREAVLRRFWINGNNVLDQYWSSDEFGNTYFHGYRIPLAQETVTFDPPKLFLSVPLSAGKAWQIDYDVFSDLAGQQPNGSGRSVMVVATEVPADALPIGERHTFGVDETVTQSRSGGRPAAQPSLWFSDGLGLVRFFFINTLLELHATTPTPVEPISWSAVKRYFGR